MRTKRTDGTEPPPHELHPSPERRVSLRLVQLNLLHLEPLPLYPNLHLHSRSRLFSFVLSPLLPFSPSIHPLTPPPPPRTVQSLLTSGPNYLTTLFTSSTPSLPPSILCTSCVQSISNASLVLASSAQKITASNAVDAKCGTGFASSGTGSGVAVAGASPTSTPTPARTGAAGREKGVGVGVGGLALVGLLGMGCVGF